MSIVDILDLIFKGLPLSDKEMAFLQKVIRTTDKHLERLQDAHRKVTGRKHKWFK